MWLLFARAPPPDAAYWPGRRWLAAVDAIVWPGLAFFALLHMQESGGIVAALAMALLALSTVRRLHTALLANQRYHFTMWRWCKVLVWLAVVGFMLKVVLPT